MKTLVIGLGNPILTDDGVGIFVARVLRHALPVVDDLEIIELSVGGITLMEYMVGYERVIIIDSVWSPAAETGTVIEFDAGQMPDTLNTASTHDADLPTALRIGRELKAALPADDHIQIIGVTAHTVLDFGDRPTSPVEAAIPEAVNRVLALLGRASITVSDPCPGVSIEPARPYVTS